MSEINETLTQDLNNARRLLKDNGYFVMHITEKHKKAMKECEDQNYGGECGGCVCDVCIMTGGQNE